MGNSRTGTMPKIGFVAMAFPGFYLGEEMAENKRLEGIRRLEEIGYQLVSTPCVYDVDGAAAAGREIGVHKVDCICVFLTTFVPDYFITELLKACERPVFLWALEREIHCLPTVCTLLISSTLKNLGKDFCIVSGEIDDSYVLHKLKSYTMATMLGSRLYGAKIGYIGHKPSIMYGMETNEYLLDKLLGVSIRPIPIQEVYEGASKISSIQISGALKRIREKIGIIQVHQEDLNESIKLYLAAKEQIERLGLSGYSINCFPHLKAKICLAVSLLNDDGIGAGCEGDLHSTILMMMAHILSGSASFNGDFLKLYNDTQSILFSHCGAGALSLAAGCSQISLQKSAETNSGVGVFYKTAYSGEVTMLNMISGISDLRLTLLHGEATDDESGYAGNPLMVKFSGSVHDVLDMLGQAGAGHHWVGMQGDWLETFMLFSRMSGIRATHITTTA